jgi:hypothetical protein
LFLLSFWLVAVCCMADDGPLSRGG